MSIQELQTLAEEIDEIGNHALVLFTGGLVFVSSVFLGFIIAPKLRRVCGKCLTELIINIKRHLGK